jgi:hypothetical protein
MKTLKILFMMAFVMAANVMFGQSASVTNACQTYNGSGTVVLAVSGSNGYSVNMGATHYGDVATPYAVVHVFNVELYSQNGYVSGSTTIHRSSCTLDVPFGCTATVNYSVSGNNSAASVENQFYSDSGSGSFILSFGTYNLEVESLSDFVGESGEADLCVNINYP